MIGLNQEVEMVGGGRSKVVVAALAMLALGACGGGDETEPQTGGTTGGPTSISVALKEWSVAPSAATAGAGSVTFQATNTGPSHKHELVVVKTDTPPQSLPTKADGTVDESAAGLTLVGEIEEFDVGGSQSKTFTLTAGKYALFCNVLEEEAMADMGGIKAHYKLGMFATFTVT